MSLTPDRTPGYQQIANRIQERIDSGELRDGDAVPSLAEIQREGGVSIDTARRVLDVLRTRGLVLVRPGVPTIVITPRVVPAPALVAEALDVAEGEHVRMLTDGATVTFTRVT